MVNVLQRVIRDCDDDRFGPCAHAPILRLRAHRSKRRPTGAPEPDRLPHQLTAASGAAQNLSSGSRGPPRTRLSPPPTGLPAPPHVASPCCCHLGPHVALVGRRTPRPQDR